MTAHTHDGGRRLALLFEAGPARYALRPRGSSRSTPPDPDPERATVRGVFPLEDLSTLMGGAAEARPGLAVSSTPVPRWRCACAKVRKWRTSPVRRTSS
jgi:hypothetical protein